MELIEDKGNAYQDMSKFDVEFLKNVILDRHLEVNGKQSIMSKPNGLKKKYCELFKANPNLLDDLFNKFPEFNEDYVPPEPEAVLKFYEEFYKKYGDVCGEELESD